MIFRNRSRIGALNAQLSKMSWLQAEGLTWQNAVRARENWIEWRSC